jgi:hypothetical protein
MGLCRPNVAVTEEAARRVMVRRARMEGMVKRLEGVQED